MHCGRIRSWREGNKVASEANGSREKDINSFNLAETYKFTTREGEIIEEARRSEHQKWR